MEDKKKYSLDIFDILSRLSSGNTQLWDELSEEEQKGLAPLVIMRWLSGTSDMRQIVCLNECANPFIFSIGASHNQLLMMLLAISTSKKQQRYFWRGMKKKEASNNSLTIQVLKEYYEYSNREALLAIQHYEKDDIINLSAKLGWQPVEIKKLTKELNAAEKTKTK